MRQLLLPLGILLILSVAFAYLWNGGEQFSVDKTTSSSARGNTPIGGPFTMVDQRGNTVNYSDFDGKYRLVYFGYTFCPDVCPVDLQIMGKVIDQLGNDAEKVVPLFISVDPERDTPEHLANVIPGFHPDIIALTGTPEQLKQAASAFKVYYAKATDNNTTMEYLMDHSSFMYFMDKEGLYAQHFAHGTEAETIIERIQRIMAEDMKRDAMKQPTQTGDSQ